MQVGWDCLANTECHLGLATVDERNFSGCSSSQAINKDWQSCSSLFEVCCSSQTCFFGIIKPTPQTTVPPEREAETLLLWRHWILPWIRYYSGGYSPQTSNVPGSPRWPSWPQQPQRSGFSSIGNIDCHHGFSFASSDGSDPVQPNILTFAHVPLLDSTGHLPAVPSTSLQVPLLEVALERRIRRTIPRRRSGARPTREALQRWSHTIYLSWVIWGLTWQNSWIIFGHISSRMLQAWCIWFHEDDCRILKISTISHFVVWRPPLHKSALRPRDLIFGRRTHSYSC